MNEFDKVKMKIQETGGMKGVDVMKDAAKEAAESMREKMRTEGINSLNANLEATSKLSPAEASKKMEEEKQKLLDEINKMAK